MTHVPSPRMLCPSVLTLMTQTLVVFACSDYSVDSWLEGTRSDHHDHIGLVWVCVRAACCMWGPAWVMWAL